MPSREELESHPVTTLKKEISKTNIKGYSKMKKPEIVELMLKNKSRFHHIKMAEKKPKKGTHKMPDGSTMSGSVHSKDSKPVEKPKEKPKKKKLVIKEKPKEKPAPKKEKQDLNNFERYKSDWENDLKWTDKFNVNYLEKVFSGKSDEKLKKLIDELQEITIKAQKRSNEKMNKMNVELKKLDLDNLTEADKRMLNELAKIKMKYESRVKNISKNIGKALENNKKNKEKPKAKLSEVDFMEKSILDDIEKEVKKGKYKDRLDMNTLIEAGENMEKSQRLRVFEIIKKIRKTINTKEVNNLYPLEVIKKRLKLSF